MNASIIAGGTGYTVPIPIEYYPDGTPMVRHAPVLEHPRLLVRPHNLSDFMAAMFWAEAWKERGRQLPELILPLVPGSRQDRLNSEGDKLFTAKSIARIINAIGFPRVIIIDPHSDVIAGLIDRCCVVHADEVLKRIKVPRWGAIVAPDAGAEKRAARVAKMWEMPLLHAWKARHIVDGALYEHGMEVRSQFTMRHVLVVDDICDGGATFVKLGELLKARGLTADLYVTHGLFTKGYDELAKLYGGIITTDSVINDSKNIVQLDICAAMLTGKNQC